MSGRRRLPALVRWLHTYVSLLAFAALFLFSVTGLTLNHAEWFERSEPVVREASGTAPAALLPSADVEPELALVDRLGVVEWLRKALGARGELHELTCEDGELFVIFKGPSYTCDVTIELPSGAAALVEERRGAVAWLDDLHKGRHTGGAWSLVIDASAVVSTLASVTGLWLLLYVRRRLRAGLITALVGGLVLALVAWLWVP
ncbi:MAG: PepSY-associated TM helix domain-containing protein [Planctomycetota bacterium]